MNDGHRIGTFVGGLFFIGMCVLLGLGYKEVNARTIAWYESLIKVLKDYPWTPLVFAVFFGLVGILMIASTIMP